MIQPRTTTEWERLKMDTIRSLPAHELRGWYQHITTGAHGVHRHPFPGEIAACADRARALGITLNEVPE